MLLSVLGSGLDICSMLRMDILNEKIKVAGGHRGSTSPVRKCPAPRRGSDASSSRAVLGCLPSRGRFSSLIFGAKFTAQPPASLRKSNFFRFAVEFLGEDGSQLTVEKAEFGGFIEQNEVQKQERNGIRYILDVVSPDGNTRKENIYLRIIDSSTKLPVKYEGQDRDPDMKRVMLTHEITCSRCREGKSCGNRADTPANPAILNGSQVSFNIKCNQNCSKSAGNPREQRRFQVALSLHPSLCPDSLLSTSTEIFVHNNSKHKGSEEMISCSIHDGPTVLHIVPSYGDLTGRNEVHLVGRNLHSSLVVYFGDQRATILNVLQGEVIIMAAPGVKSSGMVSITLYDTARSQNIGTPLVYEYFDFSGILSRIQTYTRPPHEENSADDKAQIFCRIISCYFSGTADDSQMTTLGASNPYYRSPEATLYPQPSSSQDYPHIGYAYNAPAATVGRSMVPSYGTSTSVENRGQAAPGTSGPLGTVFMEEYVSRRRLSASCSSFSTALQGQASAEKCHSALAPLSHYMSPTTTCDLSSTARGTRTQPNWTQHFWGGYH